MKNTLTLSMAVFLGFAHQSTAQLVVENDSVYNTTSQMLLANELFESGEPFAEALGYNLDLLDPAVLNATDSISYTLGIENYEYSRYLLNTLTGRSGMGLHMMWSPIVSMNASMQPASFDGMFTGGMINGYKEDDMLMMMIGNFGMNANQTPPMNAFPQFADFSAGNNNLPQTVAPNFDMDFGTTRWDRSLMDKTLNLGAMGQSMWKQYYWAQDMLGAFHDGNDNGINPTGTNSPDSLGSPNFDPNNNIYYGGNNLDGYIGQVLTAVSINKTNFLINNLAYDGTSLGMVNPATYDPANGIQYFPTKIGLTESMVMTGLPPQASNFTVIDATSQLFDQLSFLLATTSFKNMMEPANVDADHFAFKEVFDGSPFPADMAATGTPGPYDLMKGTSKVLFLNTMAMHFNGTEGTFVDEASLDGSGQAVLGNTISAENASYIILALSKVSAEFNGTPLQIGADNALVAQADFIISQFKDASGGYYNNFTIGTGGDASAKTLGANSAIVRGLYAAYVATGNTTYLTEADNAYNYLINNFYSPAEMVFKTTLGNNTATYTPWNLALLSGALREANLVGNHLEAPSIYTRVFKKIYNGMILSEAEASGESGADSDGDGVPYIAGGTKPFVFAEQGVYTLGNAGVSSIDIDALNIRVFPNPAKDFVTIQFNANQGSSFDVSIYDVSGRMIMKTSLDNHVNGTQEVVLSVSELQAGNYILRIEMNNEPVSIEKLVIN